MELIYSCHLIGVHYITTFKFAPINQANVAAIVQELKALKHPGIKYGCWLLADGKTFMYFGQFENEAAHDVLKNLDSFKLYLIHNSGQVYWK